VIEERKVTGPWLAVEARRADGATLGFMAIDAPGTPWHGLCYAGEGEWVTIAERVERFMGRGRRVEAAQAPIGQGGDTLDAQ
jgi:hypothetical protein